MKETKLTLFVTVLAVALFGVGCASTPKGPPIPSAVKWNGHWYAFLPDQLSWDAAKSRCEKLGGHLVVIDSEEENKFVLNHWKKNIRSGQGTAWIGATDKSQEGTFKWISPNNKRLSDTYSNWDQGVFGKPSAEFEYDWAIIILRHGFTARDGRWSLGHQKESFPFICEWE